MARIRLEKPLRGRILDVGGGGECMMGRVYGAQTVAIDIDAQELAEAPDVCEKRVMDARSLDFPDGCFDHVTAFYALLYMDAEGQRRAIAEAARVLRTGGSLCIWDTETADGEPPYLAELDVDAAGQTIHVTYGVIKDDAGQTMERTVRLCEEAGLHVVQAERMEKQFFVRAVCV